MLANIVRRGFLHIFHPDIIASEVCLSVKDVLKRQDVQGVVIDTLTETHLAPT